MTLPLALSLKTDGIYRVLAESDKPKNEKTRRKAGFSGGPEILKAFSGTLYGAAPGVESEHLLLKLKVNF
jgi:hypothetical protein